MSIKDNFIQYEKEQNEILEYFVYDNFYPKFKAKNSLNNQMGLEFFITSTCNKKCTYCYLHKNQDKLYPEELRNPELIINNLKILLNHFSNYNDGKYSKLDLFSGEIWGSFLGNKIFDILIDYGQKKIINFETIIVPSNCSFLTNKKQADLIQDYINKFKEIKTRLVFSCSSDGLIVDEISRPYNVKNKMGISEFYDELWEFANKNNFCFHPMVDAYTIDLWQDNLKWWIEKTEQYGYNIIERVMMLEVRNANSWNDETITSYLKFLKQITEYLMKQYDNVITFLKDTFEILPYKESILKKASYFPWTLRTTNRASCSVTQSMCIRLGDLTICPCHRLAYPKLNYGQYIVENGEIVGLKANNIAGMINHYITGYSGYLKCDSCVFAPTCIKGCHGAQFEDSKEYLYPIDSVCEMQKAKILYIFYNILELAKKIEINDSQIQNNIKFIEDQLNLIKNKESEVYNKWIPIIQNLLLDL